MGLADVVEGGTGNKEETKGFGGSAWVSFGVGWLMSGWGDGGRGAGCTWLAFLEETTIEALRLVTSFFFEVVFEAVVCGLSVGGVICSSVRAQ